MRQILVLIAAASLAAWTGLGVAGGDYLWPGLIAVLAVAAILSRVLHLSFDIILLGLVVFGYLVGNRGFAQLMPMPGLPLLPAEIALGCAVAWRLVVCAFARRLPFERDSLHMLLFAWLVLGTGRFVLDFRQHHMLAARDFALVYYSLFFFLTVQMSREPRARAWLLGCVFGGLLVLPVTLVLSLQFPGIFFDMLTLRGAPLVFFKGDLAFTFLGVSALAGFHGIRGRWRPVGWAVAAVFVLAVVNSNNRSSLAGLLVATTLLAAARRWRFPALLVAITTASLLILIALATLADNTWAESKLAAVKDRVVSLIDFRGSLRYESDESNFKGANNRFRKVWWENVIEETWQTSPVLGLGFGHDLAAGFLQEYYPDNTTEEFTARSPHNVFLTVFGRMGLAGAAVWCGFCLVLLARTWRALRHSEDETAWALWCGLWVVLVSATFGVVLEGPMGAVPFWIALGLVVSPSGEAASAATKEKIAEVAIAPLPAEDAGV